MKCLYCKKEFEPKMLNYEYCSDECYYNNRKSRPIKIKQQKVIYIKEDNFGKNILKND